MAHEHESDKTDQSLFEQQLSERLQLLGMHEMRRLLVTLIGLAAVLSLLAGDACGSIPSIVTDLGTLGGTNSFSTGINASGQVVGQADTSSNSYAFRSEAKGGVLTSLGTFSRGSSSLATAINSTGQVAGYATNSSGNYLAFRTTANGTINSAANLGTLSGGTESLAYGINDDGQVVGSSDTTINVTDSSGNTVVLLVNHAFRTAANSSISSVSDLGTLGGYYSIAYSINAGGQAVGQANIRASDGGDGPGHAFRTSAAGVMSDLGTLGGYYSAAYGINARGQAVGQSATTSGGNTDHAFRTAANSAINPLTDDLGTLGGAYSIAYAINSNGWVVGQAGTIGGADHAFLYTGNGPMLDLNSLISPSSGWTLLDATDINDNGQIVGRGYLATDPSVCHAFLLTVNTIPEPSTLSLFTAGVIGLFAHAWRRQRRQT